MLLLKLLLLLLRLPLLLLLGKRLLHQRKGARPIAA